MLECVPESLFNSNFRVTGPGGEGAQVRFRTFSEEGSLRCGGREHEVTKLGWLSGQWNLSAGGSVVAMARKDHPFLRVFVIRTAAGLIEARAQMPFTRSYEILAAGRRVGTIEPAHAFTRRATIRCADTVPVPIQLFCFWLAALTWRRAARSRSS